MQLNANELQLIIQSLIHAEKTAVADEQIDTKIFILNLVKKLQVKEETSIEHEENAIPSSLASRYATEPDSRTRETE